MLRNSPALVLVAFLLSGCTAEGKIPAELLDDLANVLDRAKQEAAVKKLASYGEVCVHGVLQLLRERNDLKLQFMAVEALKAVGKAGVPALIPYATDKSPNIRLAVMDALQAIGDFRPSVLALLERAKHDGNPKVNVMAQFALYRYQQRVFNAKDHSSDSHGPHSLDRRSVGAEDERGLHDQSWRERSP